MTCDVCGEPVALRMHDGQTLCPQHKGAVVSTVKARAEIEPAKKAMDKVSGLLAEAVQTMTAQTTELHKTYRVSADHYDAVAADLAKKLDDHEKRVNAAECALGNTRDILGDFFTRADGTTQIAMLAAEITGLRAKYTEQSARVGELETACTLFALTIDTAKKMTIWQRLRWLFGL